MARGTQAVVDVIINNEKANASLRKMAERFNELTAARDAAAKTGNATMYEQLGKDLNSLGKKIKEYQKNVIDVEGVLNKLNKVSLNDLKGAQRKISAELNNMARGTQEYRIKAEQLKKVQQELADSTGVATTKMGGFWSKIKNTIFTLDIGRVVQQIIGQTKRAVDAYAEYDDRLADIMKTTGLTKDQTEELSASLATIDTRSSQSELQELASQAGKLGLSAVEDVEKFTIAADKIGVALGDDLGDKEQAINSIGKLSDLFGLKDEYGMGDAMLKIGSAVNALGAASTANEGYIVDFISRTGGIAISAKIAASNIMALGATFNSLSQPAEASATVLNKVVVGMFDKTAQYAKVAKMEVKDFAQLLKTDANEALLRVLEGMKGADLGATADMLGEVGENGARAAQALTTISDKIDMVRAQQELARIEFEKGTSVIDEFNIRNNTAQARREKQRKEVQATLVALGEKLQPILHMFYAGSITAMKALQKLLGVLWDYKGLIITITSNYVAYHAVQKASMALEGIRTALSARSCLALQKQSYAMLAHTTATKAGTAAGLQYTLGAKAMAIAQSIVTLNFRSAAVAAKAFFGALGPIGWAITAITGYVAVMELFGKKTSIAAQNTKRLADITTQANQSIVAEKMELESYLRVASDKARSDQIREQAIKELQRLLPDGIDLINQETIANGKAKIAVDKYCESLLLRAQLEAAKDMLVAQEKERLQKMQNGESYALNWWQYTKSWLTGFVGFSGASSAMVADYMNKNSAKFKEETTANANFLTKYIDDITNILSDASGGGKPSELCKRCGKTPCECYKTGAGKKQTWTLESDAKFAEQRVALKQRQLAGEFATDEECSKKLLALEIATLTARIDANKEKGADLLKLKEQLLDKQIEQAQSARKREQELEKIVQGGESDTAKAHREYTEKLKDAELFGKDMATMTTVEKAALLQIEREYTRKRGDIGIKELQEGLDRQQKALDKKLTTIRLAQSDELAAADTLAKKKMLLEKWFSKEALRNVTDTKEADRLLKAKYAEDEQAATKAELTAILTSYQNMAAEIEAKGGLFGGMVKLTEEEREKLEQIIDKLREQISKLNQDPAATPKERERKKIDVLGMSVDDWKTLFENTENGLTLMEKMEIAAKAIGQAFSDVSDLMAAVEARDLKNYEKSQDKKKKRLDKQLKAGTISQEKYNEKVQAIDEQTDAKRQEIERKQAERQKALAVFDAMVNTAVAVATALKAGPIFASIIGALGAIQVAAIIAQPLPGKQDGGWVDVIREQDGKPFRAKNDPDKRGMIGSPTVIVGEGGPEYVVPADGYSNPTVRPVLNLIEQARLRGQLNSINLLSMIHPNTISGRAKGGAIAPTTLTAPITAVATDLKLEETISKLITVVEKLGSQLDHPIQASVSMTGEKGIAKNLDKYNALKDRATINHRPQC